MFKKKIKPKPKATAVPSGKKKGTGAGGLPQVRADLLADLREAIGGGKDSTTELLSFASDSVVGRFSKAVSTGSIGIDRATGVGGLPYGRLVEVTGAESSGKTTLTDHVMKNVQADGGICLLYEPEAKKDLAYSKAIGVDVDALQVIEPKDRKSIEAGIMAIHSAARTIIEKGYASKVPVAIVWDSIASTPTLEELDNPGTKAPSVAARTLRQMLRLLTADIARAQILFLVVNQQYQLINSFGFGPKKTTYGGGGIRYHASMRLEMIRVGTLKGTGGVKVGIEGICKMDKNNLAPPSEGDFAISWGRGFNTGVEVWELLKGAGYIAQGGAACSFGTAEFVAPVRWNGGLIGLETAVWPSPNVVAQVRRGDSVVDLTGPALREEMERLARIVPYAKVRKGED